MFGKFMAGSVLGTALAVILCMPAFGQENVEVAKPAASEESSDIDYNKRMMMKKKKMAEKMQAGEMKRPVLAEMQKKHETKMQKMNRMKGERAPYRKPRLVSSLQRVVACILNHGDELNLTGEQRDRIEDMLTSHLAAAALHRARMQGLMMQVNRSVRRMERMPDDLEAMLQEMADETAGIRKEALDLYADVLDLLTDSQRDAVRVIVHGAFPPAWESMSPPWCELGEAVEIAPEEPAAGSGEASPELHH